MSLKIQIICTILLTKEAPSVTFSTKLFEFIDNFKFSTIFLSETSFGEFSEKNIFGEKFLALDHSNLNCIMFGY